MFIVCSNTYWITMLAMGNLSNFHTQRCGWGLGLVYLSVLPRLQILAELVAVYPDGSLYATKATMLWKTPLRANLHSPFIWWDGKSPLPCGNTTVCANTASKWGVERLPDIALGCRFLLITAQIANNQTSCSVTQVLRCITCSAHSFSLFWRNHSYGTVSG